MKRQCEELPVKAVHVILPYGVCRHYERYCKCSQCFRIESQIRYFGDPSVDYGEFQVAAHSIVLPLFAQAVPIQFQLHLLYKFTFVYD